MMAEFSERVLRIAKLIPKGKVTTYSEIARALGRPLACRAVGQALRRNARPVEIPCHRVVRSDGGIGGYSGSRPGKIRQKAMLLSSEGVEVGDGMVNLGRHMHKPDAGQSFL